MVKVCQSFGRSCTLAGLGLMLAAACAAQQGEGKTMQESAEAAFGNPPLVRLIRDPHTHVELTLSAGQIKATDELLMKVDAPLWRIRDFPLSKVMDQGKPIIAEFELGLQKILDVRQQQRLKQIARQIQSLRGIVEPEMAREIGLTQDQVDKLRAIFEASSKRQASLQEASQKAGGASEALSKSLQEAQGQERDQVAKVLEVGQQKKLAELVGRPFDFGKLKHLWVKAPEFSPTTDWLQSKPLKLSEQRGRVVVVHFFAFGCINCIHNYPWYREWSEKYSPTEVTIIGIHTPETSAEHHVATLKEKLKENRLTFPIAVDNDKKNWDAWGNNMWPSVYVIDKEGYVRAWWYGELDWRGAGGQKILSQRIDGLLKETSR